MALPDGIRGGGWGLFSLNAVWAPDAWRRLESTALAEELEGPRRDLLKRVAGLAELDVDFPEILLDSELSHRAALSPRRCRTLLDALDHLLTGMPSNGLILERDRILLLSRGEAWRFWREWARNR